MANYVDFDYWVQGYGEGDLSQPDLYVVAGYWDAGYCENEDTGGVASITATATVTAKAVDFILGTASITGNATVTALCVPDLYVVSGYWVGGYCENEDTEPSASIVATATVTAVGTEVFDASASIEGTATVTIDATLIEGIKANITGLVSVSANGSFVALGAASVIGNATVVATVNSVFSVSSSITANADVGVIGEIIGYEWTTVTPQSTTWAKQ
jgi:hypothetical protein